MESDLQHQQHHQKQMNSGLMRYQSAPSSYFSSLLDRELDRALCEEYLNRPSSPETERLLARFLVNSGGNMNNPQNQNLKQESPVTEPVSQQAQIMASVTTNDTRLQQQQQQQQQQQSSYSSASQGFYQSQSRPPLPDQNSGSGMDYRAATSMGMKIGSNLVRHSSSPAGLFSNINIEFENGYPVMRGMGDFASGNRETSFSASGRPPSSSGRMSPIAEVGNQNMEENRQDNSGFGEQGNDNYVTSFQIGSWDESAIISAGAKGLTDDDRTLSGLNASETQNFEAGKPPRMLAHHLSLPKTSAEISAIEKYLQLQDSVPCKIRAKRGCATHPRSIAERVRRTRISERMRKLQDLVPNMDKQTNTADMLDLAVDYIKDLQRQVKTLSENRGRCTCSIKQQT